MKREPSEVMIDLLYKPKKAKLRDLAGIFLYGIGVSLMSPEWRKYNFMLIADHMIRSAASEAATKRGGRPAEDQVKFRSPSEVVPPPSRPVNNPGPVR